MDARERDRAAQELAPSLPGLTRADAQARADEAGVHIRFAEEGQAVTLAYELGRVTATLRDDVVVDAAAG